MHGIADAYCEAIDIFITIYWTRCVHIYFVICGEFFPIYWIFKLKNCYSVWVYFKFRCGQCWFFTFSNVCARISNRMSIRKSFEIIADKKQHLQLVIYILYFVVRCNLNVYNENLCYAIYNLINMQYMFKCF